MEMLEAAILCFSVILMPKDFWKGVVLTQSELPMRVVPSER